MQTLNGPLARVYMPQKTFPLNVRGGAGIRAVMHIRTAVGRIVGDVGSGYAFWLVLVVTLVLTGRSGMVAGSGAVGFGGTLIAALFIAIAGAWLVHGGGRRTGLRERVVGGFFSAGGQRSRARQSRRRHAAAWSRTVEGDFAGAAVCYRALLRDDPEQYIARFRLGLLYHHRLREPDRALGEYRVVLTQVPADHPMGQIAATAVESIVQKQRRAADAMTRSLQERLPF